jgi:hypothetical protein
LRDRLSKNPNDIIGSVQLIEIIELTPLIV